MDPHFQLLIFQPFQWTYLLTISVAPSVNSQYQIYPHSLWTHLPTLSVDPSVNPSSAPICQPTQWPGLLALKATYIYKVSNLSGPYLSTFSVIPSLYPCSDPSVSSLRGPRRLSTSRWSYLSTLAEVPSVKQS